MQVAEMVVQSTPNVPRSIFSTGDPESLICVAFGTDGYAEDARSRVEVGVLREYLRARSIDELGFGVSEDGSTWVMIIRAESPDELQQVLRESWAYADDLGLGNGFTGDVEQAVKGIWAAYSKRHAG